MNFLTKNEIFDVFEPRINLYCRKSGDEEIGAALRLFLLELYDRGKAVSERYVNVALRHEFIRLSKLSQARQNFSELTPETAPISCDFDTKISVKTALQKLTKTERETVILHRVHGLTFTEIAAQHGCTRQAENKRDKRALDKLKSLL